MANGPLYYDVYNKDKTLPEFLTSENITRLNDCVEGNEKIAGRYLKNPTTIKYRPLEENKIELLYLSLSVAIHNALEIEYKNNKDNLVQSIAEISLRMKEVMKANLPIFHNLFSLLKRRVEFLKIFGQMGIVKDNISMSYLNKMSNVCTSMLSTISSVMNELNDAPLYLEVDENSITDYNNSNNKYPFMPLSSAAHLSPGERILKGLSLQMVQELLLQFQLAVIN